MDSEESNKYTVVFIPKETPDGEISCCMGLATLLVERGHRVIVVVNHKNQLFIEDNDAAQVNADVQDAHNESTAPDRDPDPVKNEQAANQGKMLEGKIQVKQLEIIEFHQGQLNKVTIDEIIPSNEIWADMWNLHMDSLKNWLDKVKEFFIECMKALTTLSEENNQIETLVEKYQPDIFVMDGRLNFDAIKKTGKPWVWLYNGNPLRILTDKGLPPPCTGFPSNPTSKWRVQTVLYRIAKEMTSNVATVLRATKGVINLGLKVRKEPFQIITGGSPYLNIYGYPAELDYQSAGLKSNMYRVDTFLPKQKLMRESLKIPEDKMPNLFGKTKMILVLMGSFHSNSVKFRRTLLNYLSDSSHYFLVSKEFPPENYTLSPNMIPYDPTITHNLLIYVSDLVISDGNDSRVVTTFSHGKPTILLPFWLTQLDNAQRVHETGFGIRLSPWTYKKSDILGAIEVLMNDKKLKERLSIASKRIIQEDRLSKAAELIENLGKDKYFYQNKKP